MRRGQQDRRAPAREGTSGLWSLLRARLLSFGMILGIAFLLMVSLVGLTLFPAAGAPIWRRLFDAGDLDYAALQRHVLVLLGRGLELDP